MEGSGNADSPIVSPEDVVPKGRELVEEQVALPAGGAPSTFPTMGHLPFAEPTSPVGISWTGSRHQPGGSAASRPGPTPGTRPGATGGEWINFFPVDRKLVGKVKKPEGRMFCGGYSDVYKCEVRFETFATTNPKAVAVKELRPVGLDGFNEAQAFKRMIERVSREAHTWLAVCHPNVVPLVGYTFIPLLSLISPWYDNGCLRPYIAANPNVDRLKILLDIAKGLAYLHSRTPPIVHGDIKPENILMNDNGDALIMDFGLATVMEANPWYSSSHRQGGTVRYMAPELLFNDKVTRSCSTDVFSYGGVAFEIMTSDLPYGGLSGEIIHAAIGPSGNLRSPCDDWSKYPQLPSDLKDMIIKCWSRSPRRPTMMSIEEGLGWLLNKRTENLWS